MPDLIGAESILKGLRMLPSCLIYFLQSKDVSDTGFSTFAVTL